MNPAEPETRGGRARWIAVGAAVILAAAGALLAPAAWPTGAGRLECSYRDFEPASFPVQIGSATPLTLDATLDAVQALRLQIRLPAGVPVEGAIQAEVAIVLADAQERPALEDVRLLLILPDGRQELVPLLRWDDAAGVTSGVRRPPRRAQVVLALLGLVIVLWITEVIPLFVTSLLVPVVIVASQVADIPAAFAPFFHPIIALFFGGFLMAEAMRRVGLDRRIAVHLVARAGRSPGLLFAALLGTSAFLSMWMSNTAATALLIPIALAVNEPIADLGYRKVCVLGIAYAATVGGVGSLIGSPANPLAAEFLDSFAGRTITFADWFAFGLPFVLLFLPLMGFVLWRGGKVDIEPARFALARRAALDAAAAEGPVKGAQWAVLGVLALVVAAWLTPTWHGVSTGVVALAGAGLLALIGTVRPVDLTRISWSALITFGGGLALGVFLGTSGTADWLATRLASLSGLEGWASVAILGTVALALTTVASNTASAALLIPISIPLAGVLGVDPVRLVVIVAIASSIDFALVIGTPPTMIAYATRLFTSREIFRTGIVLDLLGLLLLLTAVVGIWYVLGLVS